MSRKPATLFLAFGLALGLSACSSEFWHNTPCEDAACVQTRLQVYQMLLNSNLQQQAIQRAYQPQPYYMQPVQSNSLNCSANSLGQTTFLHCN